MVADGPVSGTGEVGLYTSHDVATVGDWGPVASMPYERTMALVSAAVQTGIAAVDGSVVGIALATPNNWVAVDMAVSESPPPVPDLDERDDLMELSFTRVTTEPFGACTSGEVLDLGPLPIGTYRMRVHRRGADEAVAQGYGEGEQRESVLLQVWPAPLGEPAVLQRGSDYARRSAGLPVDHPSRRNRGRGPGEPVFVEVNLHLLDVGRAVPMGTEYDRVARESRRAAWDNGLVLAGTGAAVIDVGVEQRDVLARLTVGAVSEPPRIPGPGVDLAEVPFVSEVGRVVLAVDDGYLVSTEQELPHGPGRYRLRVQASGRDLGRHDPGLPEIHLHVEPLGDRTHEVRLSSRYAERWHQEW